MFYFFINKIDRSIGAGCGKVFSEQMGGYFYRSQKSEKGSEIDDR
jgi:hypothetical protein